MDVVTRPRWRILCIGGSSGTGKTTFARRLAQRYGISVLLVDDIRMAIQAVFTPHGSPMLHPFIAKEGDVLLSPESVVVGLQTVATALEPALRMVMAHHLAVEGAGPLIIEGDGILPRLASVAYLKGQPEFQDVAIDGLVTGVVLFEDDSRVIHENMLARGRGLQRAPAAEREARSKGSWRFGHYLVDQAMIAGVSVLPARPFESLEARIITAVGE